MTKNRKGSSVNNFFAILGALVLGSVVFLNVFNINKPPNLKTGYSILQGDVNNDGRVDILDFQLLSNSFGKGQEDPGYNTNADFNNDARIDVLDFQLLSNNFGTTGIPTVSTTPNPTQPADGQTVSIIAAGDVACGPRTRAGSPCKEWATSELIRQENPNAVFALGDLQYEGGEYNYFTGNDTFCRSNPPKCYNGTWGRFKSITYPVIGNHEYGTSGASGYFDYFNGTGNQTGRAGDRSKGYYSFNIGSWHVIVLNSNCTKITGGCSASSPQISWLKQDLAQNERACTLAAMHHSKFSSGHDGNNLTITSSLLPLWQVLYDANADVVLGGHSHNYERFAPLTPGGTSDNNRGIRQFVMGTGGRDFTGWAWSAPNSQIKQNNTFGVLKLTLKDTSYDWQFLPIAGSAWSDTGTGNCH